MSAPFRGPSRLRTLRAWLGTAFRRRTVSRAELAQAASPGLLYGIPAIADFLGVDAAIAQSLADRGIIPMFRMGRTYCSTRRNLALWVEAFASLPAAPRGLRP